MADKVMYGGKEQYRAIPDEEDAESSDVEKSISQHQHQQQQDHPQQAKSNRLFFIGGVFIVSLVVLTLTIYNRKSTHESLLMQQSLFSKTSPFKILPIHPDPPTPLWGDTKRKPLPTGAFWSNLVVREGDGPIGLYPYGIKTLDTGVQVSYSAYRRIVTNLAITDPFVTDIEVSSIEQHQSHAVESYDSLSVTMLYKTINGGKYKGHLVKSSPFVTISFDNATPRITSPMQIIAVESKIVKDSIGSQYVVTLGNNQKWLVYCSEPVALIWQENSLTSPSIIHGVVRVAILPSNSNAEQAAELLLQYVHRYPISAKLSLSYPFMSQSSIVQWQYETAGTGRLLMLGLPHQVPLMVSPSLGSADMNELHAIYGPIWSIKGKMVPIIGETWKLLYAPVQVGWHYTMNDMLSITDLDIIGHHLQEDVKLIPPTAADSYSFGKELGRMARLALIADSLGIADARQSAISSLEAGIGPWVRNTNPNALLYDKSYGGIVTTNGVADRFADFGNGWYSDHHFHYGYFIFAGAVLARYGSPVFTANKAAFDAIVRDVCCFDPNDPEFPFARHKDFFDGHSWASGLFQQSNGKGQESSSESINTYYAAYLYGQATADRELTHFAHLLLSMEVQSTKTYWHMAPPTPIQPPGGTNGKVKSGYNVSTDRIYDEVFQSRRMVGNMGALDVTTSTWFGENLEYVHGINVMPLSPVTAALFDRSFVTVEWPVLASTLPPPTAPTAPTAPTSKLCSANAACNALGMTGMCCPTMDGSLLACCDSAGGGEKGGDSDGMQDEWKALLYGILAVVDRDTAWNNIRGLYGFGSGNSKTNSLLWAASREMPVPHFNASVVAHPAGSGTGGLERDRHIWLSSSCQANDACDAAFMRGNCCPTNDGSLLGCCTSIKMLK